MPAASPDDLTRHAQDVLDRNRRGDWTCPSNDLYPHQWLWDSCFTAIGLARTDPLRAAGELRALLRGQWANGMLPHMIFAEGTHDVGSRRLWQSTRNPAAPRDIETSCITQPPIAAIATERVANALSDADRRAFLSDLYTRVVDYHRWLYRERDLRGTGLVTLIHPWECGLDSTPPWMRALARMPQPPWMRLVSTLRLAGVVRFFRRDTKYIPANERASDDDGLRMLVLARRIRRFDCEFRRLPTETTVQIEDVAFNSFLVVANQALTRMAAVLGETIDPELARRFTATESALEELWDEETGQYYSRDAVSGELLAVPTVATFLPLWTGVPGEERQARLLALVQEPSPYWPRYPVPSVATDADAFDEDRYWDGPTWINTNWAIIEGLEHINATGAANELRRRTIDLVDRSGFAEYFSPLDGEGFGAEDFSWSAALTLDLVQARV
ncbi:MAG: amylo-alpha-1,6-glucosidase [Acidimicrobiia bacterium]